MVITKDDLIQAIDIEIEDQRPAEEEAGLRELKDKVHSESALTYQEYEWLSYLVANKRESDVRDELE